MTDFLWPDPDALRREGVRRHQEMIGEAEAARAARSGRREPERSAPMVVLTALAAKTGGAMIHVGSALRRWSRRSVAAAV